MLLVKLLPKMGVPRQKRWLLIFKVVSSILLYETVWAPALEHEGSRKRIALSAFRTSCAYSTTSDEVAFMIAGIVPIDMLANESTLL